MLVRLLNSFSLIDEVKLTDRECQTNIEIEDILNYKFRDLDRSKQHYVMDHKKLASLDDRLSSFQRELEAKNAQEFEKQV